MSSKMDIPTKYSYQSTVSDESVTRQTDRERAYSIDDMDFV